MFFLQLCYLPFTTWHRVRIEICLLQNHNLVFYKSSVCNKLNRSIVLILNVVLKQDIFTDYRQPFAVTYLGASLMVIYIPIAFIKDQICNILNKRASKKRQGISDDVHPGLGSPLKYIGGQKIFEIEIQGHMNRKDSDVDLSEHVEGKPLVSRQGDDARSGRPEKEVTAKEIATYGFYIAPLWFLTEVTPLLHIFRVLLVLH